MHPELAEMPPALTELNELLLREARTYYAAAGCARRGADGEGIAEELFVFQNSIHSWIQRILARSALARAWNRSYRKTSFEDVVEHALDTLNSPAGERAAAAQRELLLLHYCPEGYNTDAVRDIQAVKILLHTKLLAKIY